MASIKEPIAEFFSEKWSRSEGWQFSEKYLQEVLALDPKGKGDIFRGSVRWLQKVGVIDSADVKTIGDLTKIRNTFAHELRNVVSTGEMPDFETFFPQIVGLVTKIDRWWVINVEMAVDDQWGNVEVDPEYVTPGTTLLLKVLEQVALGEGEAAWELHRAFIHGSNTR